RSPRPRRRDRAARTNWRAGRARRRRTNDHQLDDRHDALSRRSNDVGRASRSAARTEGTLQAVPARDTREGVSEPARAVEGNVGRGTERKRATEPRLTRRNIGHPMNSEPGAVAPANVAAVVRRKDMQ